MPKLPFFPHRIKIRKTKKILISYFLAEETNFVRDCVIIISDDLTKISSFVFPLIERKLPVKFVVNTYSLETGSLNFLMEALLQWNKKKCLL